jgi:putative ABC transport system permease protein
MIMQEYYEGLGTNKISVSAYSWGGKNVSDALYDYCLQLDDLVLGVTPNLQVWNQMTVKYGAKTLSDQNWETRPQVTLGSDQYSLCNNYTVSRGRDLSYMDVKKYNQVCVLGSSVKKNLFNYADPIGEVITINGTPTSPSSAVFALQRLRASDLYGQRHSGPVYHEPHSQQQRRDGASMWSRPRTPPPPQAITRLDGFLKRLDQFKLRLLLCLQREHLDRYQSNEQNELQQRFLGASPPSPFLWRHRHYELMLVTVTERTRKSASAGPIGAERKSIIVQFHDRGRHDLRHRRSVRYRRRMYWAPHCGQISFQQILFPGLGQLPFKRLRFRSPLASFSALPRPQGLRLSVRVVALGRNSAVRSALPSLLS